MTLLQLKQLLAAIPTDCDGLPVYWCHRADSYHVRVVMVDPPKNGEGAVPCVTLAAELDGFPPPEALLVESRRLPRPLPPPPNDSLYG